MLSRVLAFFLLVSSVSSLTKQSNLTTATTTVLNTTTRRPFLSGLRMPCKCAKGECGCCMNVLQGFFKQKACLNITYEPDEFALNVKMAVNDNVLYKNSFSGKNPAPFCVPVPRFRFVEFCVQFSNVYFARRNIHMCIDAEASWEDFTLLEWSFDCVRLGANGVAVVHEEDGGGLPPNLIDTEDQTDEDYDDSARNVPLNEKDKLLRKTPLTATITRDGDILFTTDEDYEMSV
ncbi:uncharacterized protein [Onthophagus taurus]|uniref:uncharacterized protein isoform X1 n=1 Tax=Onthophagus taurus TaxID=166361 RepID=UPI000C2034FB|nr:uncharacterized protein LOC111425510 isoform X2 [Onthophagus taurus]